MKNKVVETLLTIAAIPAVLFAILEPSVTLGLVFIACVGWFGFNVITGKKF